jgi:hypothetical protein
VTEETTSPTWHVDILRRGQPVWSLQVNETNLPPRKRKGKVVWKLPSTGEVAPRFGDNEKARLWELYKQEKKERRKKSTSKNENSNPDLRLLDEKGGTGNPSSSERSSPTTSGKSSPTEEVIKEFNSCKVTIADEPAAPPPGFAPARMANGGNSALAENSIKAETNGVTKAGDPFPPLGSTYVPSSSNQAAAAATSSLLPPPPGIPPSNATEPLARSPLLPLPRYFSTTAQGPVALSNEVATTFVQCMNDGNVQEWLGYYYYNHHAPSTLAPTSTLLMGQAQAVCQTPAERVQQWKSLTIPNQSSWDCKGSTAQAIGDGSQILVVLTGATVQPNGCLLYTLSLVLQDNQVINDVLALFAVALQS